MGPGANGARSHGSSGGGGWKCGKGGVCGGGGWGWGWSHDGAAGCVRGGGGGCGWEWSSSRDEEWDQEPWVHEKHGGVRGGLGQGESLRSGKGDGSMRGMGGGAGCVRGKGYMRSMAGCVGGLGKGGRCGAGRVEVVGVGAEKPPAWADGARIHEG